jgi:hypothetical protein
MNLRYKTILLIAAAAACLAGCAGSAPDSEPAEEAPAATAAAPASKLVHCFAFTSTAEATEEDWQAFYAATDELPSKIPGLNKVTHGKLLTTDVGGAERNYGVCMEMTDEAARAAYGEHPAHAEWVEVYSKVRVPGTTTFDYLMDAPPAGAAAESRLFHCFAFTAIAEATEADWQAFYAATDELPSKIAGLNKVTHGKLLTRNVGDAQRDYGVCMEMTDEAARQAYGEDPAHAAWVEVYSKVRVPGTTTFDYLTE